MEGVKRRRFRLDDDLTVAEWLDAAGQTGALRRHLWEPLCLAALNIPAERASAQIFANVLRDSLGSSRRRIPTCCCRAPISVSLLPGTGQPTG